MSLTWSARVQHVPSFCLPELPSGRMFVRVWLTLPLSSNQSSDKEETVVYPLGSVIIASYP
jgi:hypothetical protein